MKQTPSPEADKHAREALESVTRLAHKVDPKRGPTGRFRKRAKGEK